MKRSSSFGTSRRFTETRAEGPDSLGPERIRSSFAPPNLRGPSPAFGSTTKRDIYGKGDADGPDPGQHYNENSSQTIGGSVRRLKGMSPAFADRSGRFQNRSEAEGPDVGAYNPGGINNIGSVSQRGTFGKSAARGAGSFGSSSARRFDHRDSENVPGPGAYGSPLKPRNVSQGASSAFASKTRRMSPIRGADVPSVSAYADADVNSSMAKRATSSHNKSSGSFGSKAVRDVNGTPKAAGPGPGAYAQQDGTFSKSTAGQRGQMSSAFASNTVSTRDAWLVG